MLKIQQYIQNDINNKGFYFLCTLELELELDLDLELELY